MIHTSKPIDTLALSAIPYPVYVPYTDIPKEFLINAFGELSLSRIYAREFVLFPQYMEPFYF